MSKFELHKIDVIKGKQDFCQLAIDGVRLLDSFEDELAKSTTYLSEFKMILTYMEYVAENRTLPVTKFRDITPKKEVVREYEFKSKHLRVYAIQKKGGKIIVLCGFKSNQKNDIRSFRSLKKSLLIAFGGGESMKTLKGD